MFLKKTYCYRLESKKEKKTILLEAKFEKKI